MKFYGYNTYIKKPLLFYMLIASSFILSVISGSVLMYYFAKYFPDLHKIISDSSRFTKSSLIIITFFILPFLTLFLLIIYRIRSLNTNVIFEINGKLLINDKEYEFDDISGIIPFVYIANIHNRRNDYIITHIYRLHIIKTIDKDHTFGYLEKKIKKEYNPDDNPEILKNCEIFSNSLPYLNIFSRKDYLVIKEKISDKIKLKNCLK